MRMCSVGELGLNGKVYYRYEKWLHFYKVL